MDARFEQLVTVVVDAIQPGSDVTAAEVHRAVCSEMKSPPSLDHVEGVLELLRKEDLRYQLGEVGWHVVARLRDSSTWQTQRGPATHRRPH
ncbi:hypothetical protein AB0M22_37685 [Nocardia sp. NPDC051756]|uniref:hypothetical protein n=1 Tax=Nocardia sp. NPDC051756 TaxID=3154751 RepID=UPI003428F185